VIACTLALKRGAAGCTTRQNVALVDQLATTGEIGAEPGLAEDAFTLVDDIDSGGTLVRIHSDDDLGHALPP
jgi:hypothetical protein